MARIYLNYQDMVQDALRSVVRQVLEIATERGFPGEHHLYIAFETGHEGVVMSDHLRGRHPDEMTIVLQHQFSDLEVTEWGFSVSLSFSGRSEHLTIPYKAIISFLDPSVPFGLQWKANAADEEAADGTDGKIKSEPSEPRPTASIESISGDVINIDMFRKK